MIRKTAIASLFAAAVTIGTASQTFAQSTRACDVCPLEPAVAQPAQIVDAKGLDYRDCDVCPSAVEVETARIRATRLSQIFDSNS